MNDRVIRVITEKCMGYYEECRPKITDVILNDNGEYYCRYYQNNVKIKGNLRKVPVSKCVVESTLRRLQSLHIPANPSEQMGCDGDFTELHLGGYSGGAMYRWWSVPPTGWEELDKTASEILSWRDDQFHP